MIENDSCCVIFGDLYLENQKLYSGHIGAFTIPDDMNFVEENIDIETIWKIYPEIMVSIYPMSSYETEQDNDKIY